MAFISMRVSFIPYLPFVSAAQINFVVYTMNFLGEHKGKTNKTIKTVFSLNYQIMPRKAEFSNLEFACDFRADGCF